MVHSMESMLEKFFKDKNIKSLVIDGPWGCGKTYNIYKFVKKHKKDKAVSYISLFGYDSIDEINSKLYFDKHKIKKFVKKFELVPKFIGLNIPGAPSVSLSQSLECVLRIVEGDRKIKDQIIIFDDAERILNLDYNKIMGYFNSLISQGCRIICIMSSDNMKSEDKEGYETFKEKVFDIAFRINVDENTTLSEIFKEINVPNLDQKYVLLRNNIRLAQKVKALYVDVIGHINMTKVKLFEDDTYLLFTMCLYAVLAVFGSTNIKTFIEKDKENEKTSQDELELYRNRYGDAVIKNLRLMKTVPDIKRDIDLPGTLNGIISVLDILMLNNYKRIDKFFERESTGKYKLLNKKFYYLSDKEKKQYFDEFSRYMNDKDTVWDIESLKYLADICRYSDIKISATLIESIVSKMLQNIDTGLSYVDTDDWIRRYEFAADSSMAANNLSSIRKRIEISYIEEYQKILIENFRKAIKAGDYSKMTAMVNVESNRLPELLKLISDNEFFIPDLTETISYAKWAYCHAIANVVSNTELKDNFIGVLAKKVKQNPNDFSLMDRALTLAGVASNGRVKSFDDICTYKTGG